MNKKLSFFLNILLTVVWIAGGIVCAVMLVMAIRFQEWGRVLLYGCLALVCLELAVLAVIRLVRLQK